MTASDQSGRHSSGRRARRARRRPSALRRGLRMRGRRAHWRRRRRRPPCCLQRQWGGGEMAARGRAGSEWDGRRAAAAPAAAMAPRASRAAQSTRYQCDLSELGAPPGREMVCGGGGREEEGTMRTPPAPQPRPPRPHLRHCEADCLSHARTCVTVKRTIRERPDERGAPPPAPP